MFAAEDWHKYQEDYMRYGVDLTPTAAKPRKKVEKKSAIRISPKEKLMILALIVGVGLCCVVMVFLQATASKINYDVYTLNQEVSSVTADIDNLNVELNSYNKLDDIESVAQEQLHMVYLDQEQYVYVQDRVGSPEVKAYIASLTAEQKGLVVEKQATVATAAKQLLSQV